MSSTITVKFALGDQVHIDSLEDKTGVVIGVTWRSEDVQFEVCWWNEREHRSAWFSDWRLGPVDLTPKPFGFHAVEPIP